MTVETKEPDPKCMVRKKLAECIKGPNLIKTLIIIVCVGVVVQQITTCIRKLIDKPITTYTHFDFNKTLLYPSVTFCREPPYKFDKMQEYGLYGHPRFTSAWRDFDFENIDLDEMWGNITYDEKDMFVQYGFNASRDNVDLKATIGFINGRCYTMSPKIRTQHATKQLGYAVTLQHTAEDLETTTSVFPPGYHVFIHYWKEPYTEVTVYNGGMVESLYVNVGETLDVKLKVDQYQMINSDDDPCIEHHNYSANECTTKYVWDRSVEAAGCSGPWMESDVPRCRNYTSMRNLITAYMNTHESHHSSECPRICSSYLYNGFVTDRQKFYSWDSTATEWCIKTGPAALQTHVRACVQDSYKTGSNLLFIYFNSMMVSVYEERFNYDWNIFVADLGGSVGFLLGLSVIGLMKMFGKTWRMFIQPFLRSDKDSGRKHSETSIATIDVKNLDQNYFDKCNGWCDKISGSK
ncbi:uncharacterized protein LOC113498621 isoform X1 [Trichoplusia ni]|uniref:Uncharacterized protein LOC113498621 isoform X1 n=1 Tax=Trichoplusia ni TaxID=7111 RepID=A0A7E5W2K5_TRINI|nr:uncharacterized protein LOC113498621 isoform X1 [Trichoplusia ni]